MPRTDRSVTILTGMIIAALYVILLIGFSRESYMRRDAKSLSGGLQGARVVDDASNRMCRIVRQVCLPVPPWLALGAATGPRAASFVDRPPEQ